VISPNLPLFPRGRTCVHCFVLFSPHAAGIVGVDRRRDGGGRDSFIHRYRNRDGKIGRRFHYGGVFFSPAEGLKIEDSRFKILYCHV